MDVVDPLRKRCRGELHRPGCAHLGNDPSRKRCRGEFHRPDCPHLNPRQKSRVRPDKALSEQQVLGHPEEPKEALIPAFGYVLSGAYTDPVAPALSPHFTGVSWASTSCLCSCHYGSRDCESKKPCGASGVAP